MGTLTATDADTAAAALTWSILSGADAGKLTLTPRGVLAFAAAKDYEAPDDTGTDGAYQLTVQVSDGGRTDTAGPDGDADERQRKAGCRRGIGLGRGCAR